MYHGLPNWRRGTQTCSGGQWGACVCTVPCQTADCGNNARNSAVSNTTNAGSSANLKSGNLTHNQNVITAPKSLPFALTYNSNDTTIGPLGRGWTDTYNIIVSAVTNTSGRISSLILTENSGNNISFTPSGSLYSPDASSGDTSTIAVNANGTFTRTLKDGTLQNIRRYRHPLVNSGPEGNTTTLSYKAVKSSRHNRFHRTITQYHRGSNGQISSITDPAGQYIQLHLFWQSVDSCH